MPIWLFAAPPPKLSARPSSTSGQANLDPAKESLQLASLLVEACHRELDRISEVQKKKLATQRHDAGGMGGMMPGGMGGMMPGGAMPGGMPGMEAGGAAMPGGMPGGMMPGAGMPGEAGGMGMMGGMMSATRKIRWSSYSAVS